MMIHPSGAFTESVTGSCLWPSTYMKSDGPFQFACSVSRCEKVPDIGAFANTLYVTRTLAEPARFTRQREPFTLSHASGLPRLSVARNSCTLRAKSIFAYRPGDHTGSCSS